MEEKMLTKCSSNRLVIQDSERSQDIQRFNEIKASIYNNAPVQAQAYRPFTSLINQSPLYSPAAAGPAHTNMAPNGYATNGYGAVNAQRSYSQCMSFNPGSRSWSGINY